MISIKFIQRTVSSKVNFYTSFYPSIDQAYKFTGIINKVFPSQERVEETLNKQGFICLLDDLFDIEYRIELN